MAPVLCAVVALAILHREGPFLIAEAVLCVLPAAALAGLATWRHVRREKLPAARENGALIVMGVGALCYLASSAVLDPFFFMLEWLPRDGRPWDAMLVRWILLCLASGAVLWKWPRAAFPMVLAILAFTVAGSVVGFVRETGLAALSNDDHPSFQFRMQALADSIPRVIYYNPFWNGGKVATYAAASGSVGPALFYLPFLSFLPMDRIYSAGLLVLFVGVVPVVAGGSVRVAGGSWTAACMAAILSLGTSWGFFRWLLKFGTVGACFAAVFLLPVACLLYRLLYGTEFRWRHGFVLVVCSCFFLAWPANGIFSVALLPALLLAIPRLNRRRVGWLLGCGAVIAVIIAPLAIGIVSRTDLAGFAGGGALEHPHGAAGLREGLNTLGSALREVHPLLLWFGVIAAPFAGCARFRRFLPPILIPLLLMAGWSRMLPGGAAFERAMVPAGFLAVWPAALGCAKLVSSGKRRHAPMAALVIGLLAAGAYVTTRFYANDSQASYRVRPPDVDQLVEWIREHTPTDARVLFGGMTSHAYGGGHVAVLPMLAQREMMAADYYQFSPRLVEYFYPPREFRKTDGDVYRFLHLYNVSHVVAYDEASVVRFYRKYPDLYEEAATIEGPLPKTIFRVREPAGSLFLKNGGAVNASINRIELALEDPLADAAIRYNYSPELSVSAPAEIFPFETQGRTFIGVHPHGEKRIVVRFRNWP